jgi:hypothetical protein
VYFIHYKIYFEAFIQREKAPIKLIRVTGCSKERDRLLRYMNSHSMRKESITEKIREAHRDTTFAIKFLKVHISGNLFYTCIEVTGTEMGLLCLF